MTNEVVVLTDRGRKVLNLLRSVYSKLASGEKLTKAEERKCRGLVTHAANWCRETGHGQDELERLYGSDLVKRLGIKV